MNQSNYEKTRNEMRLEFLKYDHTKIAERFGLKLSDGYIYFDFFGSQCRVSVETGMVECVELDSEEATIVRFREADYDESMTVYDLLCWSSSDACPSGEFVNINSLSNLTGAVAAPSSKGFYSKTAGEFDGNIKMLSDALITAGGAIIPGGDISAEFDVFCGLKLIFRFWNSDEDFSAQIQLLWDKNVLLYMHYETVWYAASALISRISAAFKNNL